MRDELRQCIDALYACADQCDAAAAEWLRRQQVCAINGFAAFALDCAELFKFTARMVRRETEISPGLCAACIEACERCAQLAMEIGGEELQDCAASCRHCASLCGSLSALWARKAESGDAAVGVTGLPQAV